jgi:oligopeptide/dipeptide ABC transporter ATP-binding protein
VIERVAPLLEIRDLCVTFRSRQTEVPAVRGIDLTLHPGRILGLVGESGCGKSAAMRALLGLNPPGTRTSGSAWFEGTDLLRLGPRELRRYRGGPIGMVLQNPLSALNPVHRIGEQIVEAIRLHRPAVSRASARLDAIELMGRLSIADPERRAGLYPHEFSGGMRQRVAIAIAVANGPRLLIADEPTTALDVTVQAQIIELLVQLTRARGLSMILITHDLGLVAGVADEVAVMYAGRIVETGPTEEVFSSRAHPYTRGLLGSLPRIDARVALASIGGSPPSPAQLPAGCAFHPRCPFRVDLCADHAPELAAQGRVQVACHLRGRIPPPEPLP